MFEEEKSAITQILTSLGKTIKHAATTEKEEDKKEGEK